MLQQICASNFFRYDKFRQMISTKLSSTHRHEQASTAEINEVKYYSYVEHLNMKWRSSLKDANTIQYHIILLVKTRVINPQLFNVLVWIKIYIY